MPELADPGVVHPDIVLRSSERTIIVDTKFYKKPIDTRFGGERLRSANLYQIFAYVTNWAAAASADGRGPAGGGPSIVAMADSASGVDWRFLATEERQAVS